MSEQVDKEELTALLIEELEQLRLKRRRPTTSTPKGKKPKEDKTLERAKEALIKAGISLDEEGEQ